MSKTVPSPKSVFRMKQFEIRQDQCAMKVGTDGILLGAWVNVEDTKAILDIGTGSGLIAMMLAQRNPTAQIDAVEVDKDSYEQAKENFSINPWQDRLTAHEVTIQEFAKLGISEYDSIVCNPPFFTGGVLSTNQDRNSVRHTIKLPHGDLLRSVQQLLVKAGKFSCILPYLEGLRFVELAKQYQLHLRRQTAIKSKAGQGIERLLLEFRREEGEVEQTELITHQEDNTYTADFVNLTQDFYLKF